VTDFSFDGGNIPEPGSRDDKRVDLKGTPAFWKTLPNFAATGRCMHCHDSYPFIHTPLVHALLHGTGKNQTHVLPEEPFGPYFAVAASTLSAFKKTEDAAAAKKNPKEKFDPDEWPPAQVLMLNKNSRIQADRNKPDTFDVETAKPCLLCHRIGDRQTCSILVPDAVASKKMPGYDPLYGTQYPWKVWMPPAAEDGAFHNSFNNPPGLLRDLPRLRRRRVLAGPPDLPLPAMPGY